MVQIVTISATAAAYASEVLRPAARVSGAASIDTSARRRAKDALEADEAAKQALEKVVLQPAITSFMLTAGERRLPGMSTRAHVEEEYLENAAYYRQEDKDEDNADAASETL